MRNLFFLASISILTSGCSEKMFQPPPPEFKSWSKQGVELIEVKKKLLEYGFDTPSGFYNSRTYDDLAFASFCMEAAGYKALDGPARWCHNHPDKNLAACTPGAEIPTPDINRRLNSHYCRAKTNYQYCKENARFPELCDKNDYVNPRPECLP
ncbi:hypothetical protein ACG9X6_01425 [Acinetobacter guillouiae]|uniref:hypothetical protein n=1 Tax=Acinetobacter guillouiae TaxID=106649 RepID=UPI003AF94AE7